MVSSKSIFNPSFVLIVPQLVNNQVYFNAAKGYFFTGTVKYFIILIFLGHGSFMQFQLWDSGLTLDLNSMTSVVFSLFLVIVH